MTPRPAAAPDPHDGRAIRRPDRAGAAANPRIRDSDIYREILHPAEDAQPADVPVRDLFDSGPLTDWDRPTPPAWQWFALAALIGAAAAVVVVVLLVSAVAPS